MYFLQNSSTTILLSEAGVTKIHKEAKDIYIYKIGIRLFIEKIISLSEKVKEHAFKDNKWKMLSVLLQQRTKQKIFKSYT